MADRQKPRRSKGTGSVYRLADGRWCGQADLGWRQGRRWRRKVIRPTQRAAQQALARLLAAHQTGQLPEPTRETVGGFLQRWLATVQRPHAAASTYVRQETVIRCHLLPAFGRRPLAKLTRAEIQQYVAEKARTAAPGSVRLHHAILHSALETAVEWDLLARNPAARVRLPRAPERAYPVLDWDAAARFLQVVAPERLAALYVLGIATGLRIGECLGLQWAAVNLDAGLIRVERKLLRLPRQIIEEPPKSARSRREVELVPWAVVALRKHQAQQAAERLLAGSAWERPDLVFTDPLGRRLWDRPISSRHLPKLLAQAGLPRMTFHSLRHVFASLLLSDGADVAAVSALLGHADPSVTLRVYRHMLPQEKRGAVNRLARLAPDENA
jgi:integrase